MADLREKYIEALNDIFGRYKASSTLQNVVAAGCLIPNAKILFEGPPGTGKTTLIEMLAKAFFGSDFARVSFSQSVTTFDVFYYLNLGKLSKGVEEITPRPILTARFKLFNELGRCPATIQNELLELLEEGQKTYRGNVFKSPRSIYFFDMNPQDATSVSLSTALLDRMDVSVQVPAVGMKQEFELLYLMESDGEDLVEKTKKALKPKEMEKLWAQVEKVKVGYAEMFFLTILRSSISRCRYYDRSIYPSEFIAQKCSNCTYKGEFCSQLKSAVAFRISRSSLKFAKAFAFLRGENAVTMDDILRAFSLALPHRIELHPAVRNSVGGEHQWVVEKFMPGVETKQTLWKQAARVFGEALKKDEKAKNELKDLGDRDIAVYAAYQDWFGQSKPEIFAKVLWR